MSHPHTVRPQAPPPIPFFQPQNTYTLPTDLSHLLTLLHHKLHLLQTRTPESLAPDPVIPPQQQRYRGWITSIDVALQRDVAKLLRYQGLGRGDEEVSPTSPLQPYDINTLIFGYVGPFESQFPTLPKTQLATR
ncbi:hypothetical protein G7Y79_00055g089740 [Physcia stellaris]|nr:hypothetical protein G7Y79_00055g089740 [Physcia stellaris]